MKAKKLNNLLSVLEADPVMMDNTDISKQGNRQHEIRIRLLCLLLNLSNSDIRGNDINAEAVTPILTLSDMKKDLQIKQQEEIQKWKEDNHNK